MCIRDSHQTYHSGRDRQILKFIKVLYLNTRVRIGAHRVTFGWILNIWASSYCQVVYLKQMQRGVVPVSYTHLVDFLSCYIITKDGSSDEDTNNKIKQGKIVTEQLNSKLLSWRIYHKTTEQITYTAILESTVTYGSETWETNQRNS